VPTFRIVSPERRWRAAALVLLAALFTWRGFRYAGPDHYAGPVVGGLVAAGLLAWVIPVMRTCLIVTDEGLTDRRSVRSVQVSWPQIAQLRAARPGGPWGGFCVVVTCRDGTSCRRGLTRGFLSLLISMKCSGFAGPLRNVWPRAVTTRLLIPRRGLPPFVIMT
jgi:hypothetical protein